MQNTMMWMSVLGALLFTQDCGPPGGDDDTPGDDDDSSPDEDACPLSADGQSLLEETVDKIMMDTLHVTTYSDSNERGFAQQLIGVEQGYIGFMSLAFACTEPVWYDPYCEGSFATLEEPANPFWATRNRCSRLGCESTGVGLVQVYLTMKPRTDPDDRHLFTYDTVSPEGVAEFNPNPFVTYRIDLRDPQKVVVSSDIERNVEITTSAGETLDLTQMGAVSAIKVAGEITSGALALQFPGLAIDSSTAINVHIEILPGGGTDGSVMAGDQTLATISGHEMVISWEGDCAF